MVQALDWLTDRLGRAVSWLALAIVLLMAVNVVLRYFFSYGSVWAQELEWHLLAPLVLFGMSDAYQKGEHVRVDVVYGRFPARTRLRIDMVSAALCIAVSAVVVWLSLKYVQQAYVIDERSADPGGLSHRWVLKAFIPAGFAVLALQGIAQLGKDLARYRETCR